MDSISLLRPLHGDATAASPAQELSESLRKGVYVVIPAYNERASVGEVVRELRTQYPNVVVVDDGSSDGTAEVARDSGATVLRHIVNRGQGAALQSGLEYSLQRGAEMLVTFDADGQHDARDVARLLEPIAAGDAEITLGSRFLVPNREVPLGRRLLLAGGVLFTWIASGIRLSDTHNGIRAFSRRAASQIEICIDGMAHASEIIEKVHRTGLRYCEVPVRVRYTSYSLAKGQRSSGAWRIVLDYLMGKVSR